MESYVTVTDDEAANREAGRLSEYNTNEERYSARHVGQTDRRVLGVEGHPANARPLGRKAFGDINCSRFKIIKGCTPRQQFRPIEY